MEEKATEKQVWALTKLGIEHKIAENMTKQSAFAIIKADKEKGREMTDTEINDMTTREAKKVPQIKVEKEFHLSPEQVRTNAVELANGATDAIGIDWTLVKQIEEYLWNGK